MLVVLSQSTCRLFRVRVHVGYFVTVSTCSNNWKLKIYCLELKLVHCKGQGHKDSNSIGVHNLKNMYTKYHCSSHRLDI